MFLHASVGLDNLRKLKQGWGWGRVVAYHRAWGDSKSILIRYQGELRKWVGLREIKALRGSICLRTHLPCLCIIFSSARVWGFEYEQTSITQGCEQMIIPGV